jgi:hypothetical protein
MGRGYRDGLEALREQLDERRQSLERQEAELLERARGVLPGSAWNQLGKLRLAADVPLDSLDAVERVEQALGAYERAVREVRAQADHLLAEHRRLGPAKRALRVLAVLLCAVAAVAAVGWYRQQAGREAALAAHAETCRNSAACREHGKCGATRHVDRVLSCVATSQEDCAASSRCTLYGECTFDAGRCIATADDCADADACQVLGRCTAVDERCMATEAAHCQATDDCNTRGHCSARGDCVAATSEDCAKLCAEEGRCAVVDGHCAAASSKACQNSARCRLDGACELFEGRCIHPSDDACTSQPECSFRGECSRRNGRCVITTSIECERSTYCGDRGLCVHDGERCVADDASCMRSIACQELGRCRAVNGECI